MDQDDRRVRKFVFDHFLARTYAPALEEIAHGCRLSSEAAASSLQRLEAGRHLKLLEGTQRILMAFPFSAVATPYRVTRRSGQRYFANCAWDAVAFHPMLQEPVEIDSFCHHCGIPLHLGVQSGRAVSDRPEPPLVHLALPAAEWWNDIVRTCSNTMVFFDSAVHLEEWRVAGHSRSGAALSIEQIVELSRPIYGGKMDLGYSRPSPAELRAHFERLGLGGEFWKI
jgi:Alkylmercury lyase